MLTLTGQFNSRIFKQENPNLHLTTINQSEALELFTEVTSGVDEILFVPCNEYEFQRNLLVM